MELRIETWVRNGGFPEEARIAVLESARCHKAAAYRAALLFGYLGWSLTLRDRLLRATCPVGIPAGQWTAVQNALRNEDKWDATVFDCTQAQAPKSFFEVSDDLRHQVRYWKDRRNDCAHFKKNQITAAHVEALWAFLESNVGLFVPNGSVADLLARIERHFDPNVTPPGTDVAPIANMIPSSVPVPELPSFLQQIVDVLTTKMGTFSFRKLAPIAEVFEGIFAANHPVVVSSLVAFLSADIELLAELLCAYPHRALYFSGEPAVVRQLWRTRLTAGKPGSLSLVAALLRNNLIPPGERDEAIQLSVERLNGEVPDADDVDVLVRNGWVAALHRWVFDENKQNEFKWGNANAEGIVWLLQHEPITSAAAQQLCSTFVAEPYPFKVQQALHALFAGDQTKCDEFKAAASATGVTPPSTLV